MTRLLIALVLLGVITLAEWILFTYALAGQGWLLLGTVALINLGIFALVVGKAGA